MKSVQCLEVSNDNKTWVRIAVQSKNRIVDCCLYRFNLYKYSRITAIKVPNAMKIEKLL